MEYGFEKELYPAQKQLISDATRIIEENKTGIFSSPTGTGKTLSLLCTLMNFMKKEDPDDIFSLLNNSSQTVVYYCSRTHTQLSQVVAELRTNKESYRGVILGSRMVYCVNEKINSIQNNNVLTDRCRDAIRNDNCKFYDGNAPYTNKTLDIEDLKALSTAHGFCPYYWAKNNASECKIVFLPYNLLFTREGRESADIDLENKIIVVDEAHNICNTVIELNSFEIKWSDFQRIKGLKGLSNELKTILTRIDGCWGTKARNGETHTKLPDEFVVETKIDTFNMFEIEEFIISEKLAQKNDFLPLFDFAKFLRSLTFSDGNGRIFIDRQSMRFTPLDAAPYFNDLKKCRSILFAGGTMEPIGLLQQVFPKIEYFNYPAASQEFVATIIGKTAQGRAIDMRMEKRGEMLEEVIAGLVALTNPIVSGGIVIFVPSKAFLTLFRESQGAKTFKRKVYFEDDFIFTEFKKSPEILVAVMGGRLSEGINFSDGMCRLLVVLGVPYPTVSAELSERVKHNKDYALNNAMNTVNQAVGRAIRHKNDYAAIVLMDSRYPSLKNKLSPWIQKKLENDEFMAGLARVNRFLRDKRL
ncbi:chromosome transmission fidelity protein 1 [Enteropsectra breve]|nr:chromosome transmission fidelity protein 1 [Enteropsectra breve]